MARFEFSKAEVDALAKALREAPRPPQSIIDEFCTLWPDLEKGLKALEKLASDIPAPVGSIIQYACALLIWAGDAASHILCRK